MRSRIVCSIAAVLWFTAAGARASDAPTECTTGGGNWAVVASEVFEAVCLEEECSGISFEVRPLRGLQPDHVAVLVEHDVSVMIPESRNVAAPCAGDSVTQLGARDCSSQAVRMNRNGETGGFDLVAFGTLDPVGSSIVVKKGKTVEQCRIASLGRERSSVFDPNAQVTTSQTIDFKGCVVTIPTGVEDGEGGEASLSGEGCAFVANGEPVGIAKLLVNDMDVGFLTFGNGAISSGTSSCTTKVVNRRLYTWCTCVDADGNGVPDDPIPPCPTTVP